MAGLLRAHHAFWRAETDAPIVGRLPAPAWYRPYPLRGGRLAVEPQQVHPDDLDVDQLVDAPPDDATDGMLLRCAGYCFPSAWMEALVGCPIWVSAYGCVAKPAAVADLGRAAREFRVEKALASGWWRLMVRAQERAAELAGGRSPVRQLHLRGVIDMLAAYLGEERLCLSLHEDAAALSLLAEKFTELYIEAVRRGLTLRPPWRGGRVSLWRIHAPGDLVDYQIDASSLFSARAYEEHFLRHDRKVWRSFPYSVTHFHACGMHILEAVLKADELGVVQVQMDRETGRWEADRGPYLRCAGAAQARGRGFIAHGELAESELPPLLAALSPRGLAVEYWNPKTS